ncbi:hypothetical protein FHW64_006253 [Variovorax sp. Sphag1AA]|nr:hypothetical protein [Variovorax sp. Sphag1AA]
MCWKKELGSRLGRQGGYAPYLDCRAASRSLSLCIDPEVLTELGALGIALSVWLYEAPTVTEPGHGE